MGHMIHRFQLESDILGIISKYGGKVIIACPEMSDMIREIADFVEEYSEVERGY